MLWTPIGPEAGGQFLETWFRKGLSTLGTFSQPQLPVFTPPSSIWLGGATQRSCKNLHLFCRTMVVATCKLPGKDEATVCTESPC